MYAFAGTEAFSGHGIIKAYLWLLNTNSSLEIYKELLLFYACSKTQENVRAASGPGKCAKPVQNMLNLSGYQFNGVHNDSFQKPIYESLVPLNLNRDNFYPATQ